ncbi:DUF2971 domain-containing protein [Spirosoma validum]|uniref:DUF2971 domain-containing protein n=1 Tax=Spirosoma validum TaxID=2771355 RepID=A0A927GCM0_9BACT|nr:DUF2971 domain-containing protein [Spirosoma validum]MBD2752621.1 DUF2971 domain-containing protein [Spirosoma validum]
MEFLAKRCNTPSLIKNFSPDNKSTSSPIPTGLPGLKVIGKIDLNARTDSSQSKTTGSINKMPLTKQLDVLKEIEAIRKKIGIPDFIYKYSTINSHFLNSLKNNYLYFNNPSNFNDPFDCSTKLVDFVGSDHQYTVYLKKLGQFNVSDITSDQIQEIKEHYKNAFEEAVGNVGISCFSRSYTNILMWSHYAYNHKGVCIEFDYNADKLIHSALDVYYTDTFFKTDFNEEPEIAIGNMTFAKAVDWQYEKELRIYQVGLNSEEKRKINYNKKALTKIIFGMKCSEANRQEIVSIVRESAYPNVSFYLANPVSGKYAVELQELKVNGAQSA